MAEITTGPTDGKASEPNPFRPNVAGAIRDVLITSTSKGQIIPIAIAVVMLVFAFRMPSDEIPKFLHETIMLFENFHLLGWGISLILFGILLYIRRKSNINHSSELERITKEKNELQERLLSLQNA